MWRVFWLILAAGVLAGCTKYEFDVVEPTDLAGHVGRKQATQLRLSRGPMDYIMQAVEGRLVMRIINASEEQIELIGPESYVVDPGGQSHPLRTVPIAPDSYARLILPPLRPYVRSGPTFGFGLGVGVSRVHGRRLSSYGAGAYYPYDPWYGGPVYMAAYDNSDAFYWDWDGETAIRLRLTFRAREGTFGHDFVIQRKKVR